MLQSEVSQVGKLLPNNPVDQKPLLEGENLHIILITVVIGYCDAIQNVIIKNVDGTTTSLLIT